MREARRPDGSTDDESDARPARCPGSSTSRPLRASKADRRNHQRRDWHSLTLFSLLAIDRSRLVIHDWSMVEQCPGITKENRQCRRMQKVVPCYHHRRWWTAPADVPPVRVGNVPGRSASEIAESSDWRESTIKNIGIIIDRPTWRPGRRPGGSVQCAILASMARELIEIGDIPRTAVAEVINSVLTRRRPPLLAGWLTEGLADNLPVPDVTGLTQVAQGLQILGILLCSVLGKDLAGCPCLRDLTNGVGKELAAGIVDREFAAAVSGR